jgi:hypothetical protein
MNKEIILGGTHILDPPLFLENLRLLHKGEEPDPENRVKMYIRESIKKARRQQQQQQQQQQQNSRSELASAAPPKPQTVGSQLLKTSSGDDQFPERTKSSNVSGRSSKSQRDTAGTKSDRPERSDRRPGRTGGSAGASSSSLQSNREDEFGSRGASIGSGRSRRQNNSSTEDVTNSLKDLNVEETKKKSGWAFFGRK